MKYLCSIFIILIFAACAHNDIPRELRVAEAIMQERPDSALQLLDSIDTATLTTDEQRALYALLLTQARDKNYFLETDDSLISTAVDYYTRQGNKNREQLARFYKAEILNHKGCYKEAVPEALRSIDIAKEMNNLFEIGRGHQSLADIYHQSFNLPQAVFHRDSAYQYFKRAGKDNFALYALIELTGEAINMDDLDKGEKSLKILSKICPKDDSLANGLIQTNYVFLNKKQKQYQKALNHFHLQTSFLGDKFHEFQNYSYIADIYLSLNITDSASYYLKLDEIKNPLIDKNMAYYSVRYKLAKHFEDYKNAMIYLEKMESLSDKNVDALIDNNAALAEKDYYNKKAINEQYKSFVFKSICTFILFVSITLIIIILIVHHYRLKNQKLASEKKIYQIKQFVDEQQDIIKKLFSERFSEIDTLCAKYFKYLETNKPVSNIVKDVEKQFMAIKEEDSFESLQNYVNCVDNDILTKFKTELPDLKDNDYRFIAYKLAGFSPRSVCLLMDISTQNYYTKCNRLRNKVEKSDAKDKEIMLEALKN